MGKLSFALIVTFAFIYVSSPFIFPIAMGAILAVLLNPIYHRLEKRKFPSHMSSGIVTLCATVLLILPASFLIFLAAKTALQQLSEWRVSPGSGKDLMNSFLNSPNIVAFTKWAGDVAPFDTAEITKAIYELTGTIGSKLIEFISGMISHIPGIFLALVVMVLSNYFFLVDGKKLLVFFRKNSFFTSAQTDLLLKTLGDMCRSVILAALVSGGLQALVTVTACIFTSIGDAALIGLLVFISSFIPLVGSLPVTVFIGIQQLILGHQGGGIALLTIGVLIYGMDNAVRPIFLRGAANLHPFIAFITAVGGLQTIGFIGVFLGPICASLFLTTIQILTNQQTLRSES